MQIIAYFDKIRRKAWEGVLIKLILTTIFPDKNKQKEHDLKILEKFCREEDGCITVLELSNILQKENNLKPEEIFESLIEFVRGKREEIVLIDTSVDHYWRDVLEDAVEGVEIIHNPYTE